MRLHAGKLVLVLGSVAVVASAIAAFAETPGGFAATTNVSASSVFKQPNTLAELLSFPDQDLDKVDVGLIDLLCAEGLRGSENLDVNYCVRTLNTWASYVASETKRNQHLFDEHPERFKNSLAYYRMAMLATVLCQDFRVRYNPEREKQLENGHALGTEKDETKFFGNANDLFIQGLLTDKHYGTCASLPYLYVAIGRRLGYPVTLATTADHFYVRYEEGNGKHLNVEATEHRAFLTPSDEEYRNPWELHVSNEDAAGLHYFQPFSNKEILGHTLLTRSAVLKSMGQYDKQAETWAIASRYLPDTPMWRTFEHDMQQLAKNAAWQEGRNRMWKRVADLYIPRGPGYAYFQNQKAQLHFLMNYSFDMAAIDKAVTRFENELGAYVKPFVEPGGLTNQLLLGASGRQLVFRYTTASSNVIKIPADFLPPFERRLIPPELMQRVADKKLEDSESILNEFWTFYDDMMQARNTARLRQMNASGTGQILIAREKVPPAYWDSIPEQLQLRLNGLNDGDKIAQEMWLFCAEDVNRRNAETRREQQMLDAAYGIPGSQDSMPLELKQRLTGKSGTVEIQSEIFQFQLEERNRQLREQAEESMRSAQSRSSASTRIKLVPASVLNGDATPETVPSFPLTPLPQSQINSTNKSKGTP